MVHPTPFAFCKMIVPFRSWRKFHIPWVVNGDSVELRRHYCHIRFFFYRWSMVTLRLAMAMLCLPVRPKTPPPSRGPWRTTQCTHCAWRVRLLEGMYVRKGLVWAGSTNSWTYKYCGMNSAAKSSEIYHPFHEKNNVSQLYKNIAHD